MRNLLTRDQLNEKESTNKIPKQAQDLADRLENGSVVPHHDLDCVWIIEGDNVLGIQASYIDSDEGDWGGRGYQIGDEDGHELYIGEDIDKAYKAMTTGKKV